MNSRPRICLTLGLAAALAAAPAAADRVDEDLRDAVEHYCSAVAGAHFYPRDGVYTCDLPGDESGTLRVGSAEGLTSEQSLAESRFTDKLQVNATPGTAGSEGEDMAGYWGATIAWRRHGRLLNVSVYLAYPQPPDDTEDDLLATYHEALAKALVLAKQLDAAVR